MAETITEQAAPSLESVRDMIFASRALHVVDAYILEELGPDVPAGELFSRGFVIAAPNKPLYSLPALNALFDVIPTNVNGTGVHTPSKLVVDYNRFLLPHITYTEPIGEVTVTTAVKFTKAQRLSNGRSGRTWEQPVSSPIERLIDLIFVPSSDRSEIQEAEFVKGIFKATVSGWRKQRSLRNSVKGRLHEF